MDRRKFLKTGLAGLATVSLGIGGYFTFREERTPYNRLHKELSDYLEVNYIGRIGKTHDGKSNGVVLAVRQNHDVRDKLKEEWYRIIHKMNNELEIAEGLLKSPSLSEDYKKQLSEKESKLRGELIEHFQELYRIRDNQKQIYCLLNHVTQNIDRNLLVGLEGIGSDDYDYPDLNLSFNSKGTVLEEKSSTFLTYPAAIVLKKFCQSIRLVAVEDEALNKEAINLVENKQTKSSRFNELQILRNEYAVRSIVRKMTNKNNYGVLIFGAKHFEESKPTIPDFLEKENQSYIEFIPKAIGGQK